MAKYDTLRKLQRNKALFEYRENNPDASWEEIGEVFGVSKQRACEIYQNELKRSESTKDLETVK